MTRAALRALLVLLALVGAVTAPDPGAARADVAQRHPVRTANPHDGSGSDRDCGEPQLALLGDPAPVSLAGCEEPGHGPGSAGRRSATIPRPRPAVGALDPRRYGAFAPGERPAALAFLRMNGNANANGAGT